MAKSLDNQLFQVETSCGSLLYELQVIWDEIGEPDGDRDKMLLELEQECLEVYRRKVDQANRSRAQLRQAIAVSEAEIAAICSAMGERPVHSGQSTGSLREEFSVIIPLLDEMQKRKAERRSRFLEFFEQIKHISNELSSEECNHRKNALDESDLSIKKLEELQEQLESLQKEKNERLQLVLDHLKTLRSLCLVLGMDFNQTACEIHSSLGGAEASSFSSETIDSLASAIQRLREIKTQRLQTLQDHAATLFELWSLMDAPIEEQQLFQNVTCTVGASEHEITDANMLSEHNVNHVETEVSRLQELKASKMNELVLKKKTELEELRCRTHLVARTDNAFKFAGEATKDGTVDPSLVLEEIEAQIFAVKEETFSRKDILEKVEKWLAACEEESWLEEYNRDENRYSAGRGAHLTLKRAEKARLLVNKIPAIVETLMNRVTAWEEERGIAFTYDGVCLMSMLEEYSILRQEKEQERKRQRDQRRLQDQFIAEQEALYGSKPSPSKSQSGKRAPRISTGGPSRRISLGGAVLQKSTRLMRKVDEGVVPSAGSRGHAGLTAKKQPLQASNVHGIITQTPRKPFTPLVPLNSMPSTPSKPIITTDIAEEKRTPKGIMPIQTPTTPMTVSVPMHVANTPAPLCFVYEAATEERALDIEYSFEERRMAFLLNNPQMFV
ncbi:65-kDa microtubule-associated protein 3-like [Dioscorea cayenensis subsp. rotundata]|uniref:65-kDa microtubule-associated protein 3-like n=1 Tax=Dioscorea cayennensis subsp. rotundata TaxID=55577 RepID=A0AB40CQT6_DIOCR|nr:65-kDa microtubule-associated protein 3-like [Dioscorea cayenensis subsp. rotundata]